MYGNNLLDRLKIPGIGCHIGEICCVAPTCADDMAILADRRDTMQSLVNVAVDHSCMERYLLQPVKSVIVEMLEDAKQAATTIEPVTMKGEPLAVVDESMHMGIMRSADSQETAIRENIKKAQRTNYGLMAA